MDTVKRMTEEFVKQSENILGNRLTGIYLHGSAAMGCFHAKKSDIDLLVVIDGEMSEEDKLRYMEMVTVLNAIAPPKGIEMSIVKKSVCRPLIYPTPFELHFSVTHAEWYQRDPHGYVLKMNGTDKDLAAHIMIIYHRGRCLYGEEIREVFEEVDREVYFDSILYDVEHAEEDIIQNPVYMTLNLCRVLAYKQENLILSKLEGGRWGLENVPERYRKLIRQMEIYFDMLQSAADKNPSVLREDASIKNILQILIQYYENGQWLQDYELDEQGLLPQDLKRGVLSEDAVYHFLGQLEDIL